MSGLTPEAAYNLDRDFLSNPGLLSPPHGAGLPPSQPSPRQLFSPGAGSGDRLAGPRALGDLSGGASSLSHMQGRYGPPPLGLPAPAPGEYNQLMTHYLSQYGAGGGSTCHPGAGGSSNIPDHLKGLAPSLSQYHEYWASPSSQSTLTEGIAAHLYGLGAPPSLYQTYLSVVQQGGTTPGAQGPERLTDGAGSLFSPPLAGSTAQTDSLRHSYDRHQDAILRASLDPLGLTHHAAMVTPHSRPDSLNQEPSGSAPGSATGCQSKSDTGSSSSQTGYPGQKTGPGSSAKSASSKSTIKSGQSSLATAAQDSKDNVLHQSPLKSTKKLECNKLKDSSDLPCSDEASDSRNPSTKLKSSAAPKDVPQNCPLAANLQSKHESKASVKTPKVSPSHKAPKVTTTSSKAPPSVSTNSPAKCTNAASSNGKVKYGESHSSAPSDPKDRQAVPQKLTSTITDNVTTLLGCNPDVDNVKDTAKKLNKVGKGSVAAGRKKRMDRSRIISPQLAGNGALDICPDQKTLISERRRASDGHLCKVESSAPDTQCNRTTSDYTDRSVKCLAAGREKQTAHSAQIEIKSEKNELLDYIRVKGVGRERSPPNANLSCDGLKEGSKISLQHVSSSPYDKLVLKQSPPSGDVSVSQRPDKLDIRPINLTTTSMTDQAAEDDKTLLFRAKKQEPISPNSDKNGNKYSTSMRESRLVSSGGTGSLSNGMSIKTEGARSCGIQESSVTVAAGNFPGGIQYSVSRSGEQALVHSGVRKVHATTFMPEVGTLPSVTSLTENRSITSVADTNNNNSNSSTFSDNSSQSSTDSSFKKDRLDGAEVTPAAAHHTFSVAQQLPPNCKSSPVKNSKCRLQAQKSLEQSEVDKQSSQKMSPTKQSTLCSDSGQTVVMVVDAPHRNHNDGISVKAEEPSPVGTRPSIVPPLPAPSDSKSFPREFTTAHADGTTSSVRAGSPRCSYRDKAGSIKSITAPSLKKELISPERVKEAPSRGEAQTQVSPRPRPERPDRPLPASHIKSQIESCPSIDIKPDQDPTMHAITQPLGSLSTAPYPWQPPSAIDPYGSLLHAPPPHPPLFPHFISPQYPMPMSPRMLQMYSDKQRQAWLESAGYMFPPTLTAPQYPQSSHLGHSQSLMAMGHPDFRDFPEPRFGAIGGGVPCPASLSERRTSRASTISIDVDDSGSTASNSRDPSRERIGTSRDHSKERLDSFQSSHEPSKDRGNTNLTSSGDQKDPSIALPSSRVHSREKGGLSSRDNSHEPGNVSLVSSREQSRERPSHAVRDLDRDKVSSLQQLPGSQDARCNSHKALKRSVDGKIKTESQHSDQHATYAEGSNNGTVKTKVEKDENLPHYSCPEASATCGVDPKAEPEVKVKLVDYCHGLGVKERSVASTSNKPVPKGCHTEKGSQPVEGSGTTTTNSANIPVGIAYARQRPAAQTDVRELPLVHGREETPALGGQELGAGGGDLRHSNSSGAIADEAAADTELRLDGRPGDEAHRSQHAPIPGYTHNTSTPRSLQPIPIPPGYKLVQDKTNGQMFLLPDPNQLGLSHEAISSESTTQQGKNVLGQITRTKPDVDSTEFTNRMISVNVASVSVPKPPVANGTGYGSTYTPPWLPQGKDKTDIKFTKDDPVEGSVKNRSSTSVQRPIGAVATVVRHERTKRAATIKPHTVSGQSRTQTQNSDEASSLANRGASTATGSVPERGIHSTYNTSTVPHTDNGVTERFVTVTSGSKITASALTQTSTEMDNLNSSIPDEAALAARNGSHRAVSIECRGSSPVGFPDDVPLKYLIPRKMVPVSTCTDEVKLRCVHVQTEEYSFSVNIPVVPPCVKRITTRESAVQTSDPIQPAHCQEQPTLDEHRTLYFQQRTSELLQAASSIRSPDLTKSEPDLPLIDDSTHRNTPPVLTKMVDLSATTGGTLPTVVVPGTSQQYPGVQAPAQSHPATPLPSETLGGLSQGSQAWQATDGLQLLSTLAEQVQRTSKKAQLLSVVEERAASPDINKNYNAPKSFYFETEDFAQSTARFLRKDNEDGFQPQWTSNLFKVTTEPDNMDAMELDYRVRLAEIQRKYKEKQKELAKLNPRKSDDIHSRRKSVGRPKICGSRKSSSKSDGHSRSEKVSTSELDDAFETSPRKKQRSTSKESLGTSSDNKGHQTQRSKSLSHTQSKTKSSSEKKSTPRKSDSCLPAPEKCVLSDQSTSTSAACMSSLSAPVQSEVVLLSSGDSSSSETESDSSSDSSSSSSSQRDQSGEDHWQDGNFNTMNSLGHCSSPGRDMSKSCGESSNTTLKAKRKRKSGDEGCSLKKKRKPGRPKKIDEQIMTETIVAKKPKNFSFYSYGSSKGYGSAFKKSIKANFGSKSSAVIKQKSEEAPSCDVIDWNRRRSERIFISESRQTAKIFAPQFETSNDKSTDHKGSSAQSTTPSKASNQQIKSKTIKSRPKTQMVHELSQSIKKAYTSDRDFDTSTGKCSSSIQGVSYLTGPVTQRPSSFSFSLSSVGDTDSDTDTSSDGDLPLSSLKERSTTPEPRLCKMTTEDLKHGLSVLLFKDGLFYEGTVQAIDPPDIYGVVITGERGGKAHILPQEELLSQAVLDVNPESIRFLLEGTRVCAYWSQQFSCLYPGTVSRDTNTSPQAQTDPNLISVEFDDGDSGNIPVEHIRMLPADFPMQDLEASQHVLGAYKKRRTMSDDLLVAECKERKPFISDTLIQIGQDVWNQRKVQGKPGKSTDGHTEKSPQPEDKTSKEFTAKISTVDRLPEKNDFEMQEKPAKCQSRSYSSPAKVMDKSVERPKSSPSKLPKPHQDEEQDCDNSDSSNDDDSMATSSQSGDSDSYSDSEEDEEYVPGRVGNQKAQLIGKNKRLSEKSDGRSPSKGDREQQESDNRDKAFMSAQQLWQWVGKGTKRPGMKGRAKREYFKSIQRGKEIINVGDSAVFLSAGRTLPYVGRVVSLWQGWGGNMVVKVKWFYHPEETKGGKKLAEIRGALYQSPHVDENDVQTISHKCHLMPYAEWKAYRARKRRDCQVRGVACDWDDDVYYLAGTYDPTIGMITFQPDVKLL